MFVEVEEVDEEAGDIVFSDVELPGGEEENKRTSKEDTRDFTQNTEEDEEGAAPPPCTTVGTSCYGDYTIILWNKHRW